MYYTIFQTETSAKTPRNKPTQGGKRPVFGKL